jgi:hypothetical protein
MEYNRFSDYLYTESLQGNMSSISSSWLNYKFSVLMRKKFSEWDAYNHGLIDRSGNIIKLPKTGDEKKSLGMFENLVRKIKKAIMKHLRGDADIVQHLIGLYMVKESYSREDMAMRREIQEDLTNDEISLLEKILVFMKGDLN